MNRIMMILVISAPLLLATTAPTSAQPIPDFRVNELASINGSTQRMPSIAGDGQGNVVVTWQDKRNGIDFDIFAQIYTSDGTMMGPNFRVNHEAEIADQYDPDVAVDGSANFVITWRDLRRGDWDIYVQRYASDGTELGGHVVVNDDPDGTEQAHPSVLMDTSGNFTVVWVDERSGDWDIYAQRYAGDGTAVGDNFRINDDDGSAIQYSPTCAGNGAGDFVVTWTDQRNGDRDIYVQRFLADGTAVGENTRVNTDDSGEEQAWSAAVVDENGDFVIAWSDERGGNWDVYAQRYSSNGQVLGENFRVHEEAEGVFHSSAALSMDLAGNFVVTWSDGRSEYSDIHAQRFTTAGDPIGDSFMVNDGADDTDEVHSGITVNDDGTFSVVWNEYGFGSPGEILARSFTSDGVPVADKFKVNDDPGSENQVEPAIAMDSDENFIITWVDHRSGSDEIYAQRFSSDGTELGPDFRVCDIAGHYGQWEPTVAVDPDGYFVVVWSDYRENGCCSSDIYAQCYGPDGAALGSNFKVNYLGSDVHFAPSVAYNNDGDFVITWGDHAEDSKGDQSKDSEPDVHAQLFSRDGAPLGSNIMVNDDGGSTKQTWPSIAVDGNNNFIIAWEDHRLGEPEIFWQKYSSDMTPQGSNVRVEGGAPGDEKRGAAISTDDQGGFVIAWKDGHYGDYAVLAQRYAGDGNPVGDTIRASNGNGVLDRYAPSLAVNGAGDFVLMWTEEFQEDKDVFAQRYSSGGVPLGENYRVSDTGEWEQCDPDVVLGNSMILATWQDNRGGQSGYDIWANVMDWDTALEVEELPSPSLASVPYLYQNAPNPFNPATTIKYRIPEAGPVVLEVYDVLGRKMSTLVNEVKEPGVYEAHFEAPKLGSGVYIYRLRVNDSVFTKRMVLLK